MLWRAGVIQSIAGSQRGDVSEWKKGILGLPASPVRAVQRAMRYIITDASPHASCTRILRDNPQLDYRGNSTT